MKNIAILIVSFGTTYPKTRQKTIGAIENEFKKKFPEADIFRAFTSTVVISRIAKNEGIKIDTPVEALNRIYRMNFDRVYVQPLHIIPGIELHQMLNQVKQFKGKFKQLIISKPLLSSYKDYVEVTAFLKGIQIPKETNEATLFMGHGTSDRAFTAYACLDHMLIGSKHYLGTVESYPDIEFEISRLKAAHISKVNVQPFMIVAGNHAHNDMDSRKPHSWRYILENEGIQVVTHLKGLGEYPFIQKMFINHLMNQLKEM